MWARSMQFAQFDPERLSVRELSADKHKDVVERNGT
jgi:hypothetical protein